MIHVVRSNGSLRLLNSLAFELVGLAGSNNAQWAQLVADVILQNKSESSCENKISYAKHSLQAIRNGI